MVNVAFDDRFRKLLSKMNDPVLKARVIKQFEKIGENPLVGKPMRHARKGTREVYVSSFRLSYLYIEEEDLIVYLDLYHKDEQ